MRRSLPIALVVLASMLLPALPANAGGNWLDFRRDPSSGKAGGRGLGTWAVMAVGQRIVAHAGIYAPNPHRRERLEHEGPFYAWLSPGDSYLEGTRLPADAIRLAPFQAEFTWSNVGPVRAHFTVPSVPSGEYEVVVCNDPCTLSGFGEYVQGWVTIMQTPEEARLFALARDRKWQVRELSQKLRHLQAKASGLENELIAAERTLGVHARLQQAAGRAGVFDATRLGTGAASARPIVSGWAVVAFAIVVSLGAGIGFSAAARRRRTPRLFIPDAIPDELLERDRASV